MTPIARVIPIENLPPGRTRMASEPLGGLLARLVGRQPTVVIASHVTTLGIDQAWAHKGDGSNQLINAAYLCFEAHHPFGLRAEIIWQTILSQLALAVSEDPEPHRHLFTSSAARQEIVVREDGLLTQPALWAEVVLTFRDILRENLAPELASACHFDDVSTVGPVEQVAGAIALMKLASPYYEFVVQTMCGIPEVALFGTAADWEHLHTRVRELADLFPSLRDWWVGVERICHALASAARGEPTPPLFWRSIYRHDHRSGEGSRVSGWLAHLYLYVVRDDGAFVRRGGADWDGDPNGYFSPELRAAVASRTERVDEDTVVDDWVERPPDPRHPTVAELPPSVSSLPFTWEVFGVDRPMELVAGVMAIEWDGPYLTPRLGWALLEGGTATRTPGTRRITRRTNRAPRG